MNNDPKASKLTYTSSTGHLITRKKTYGVKKGKSSGNWYELSNADGSSTGIKQIYHTTLTGAKAHVEEITRGKNQ